MEFLISFISSESFRIVIYWVLGALSLASLLLVYMLVKEMIKKGKKFKGDETDNKIER